MRRRAVIAGCCLASALSMGGCAGLRLRKGERGGDAPPVPSAMRDLSHEAAAAMDRGDLASARVDLERLVAESPGSAEHHFRLGKVLQLQEEYPAAEASYRRALKIEKQYVGALVGLGQVAVHLGRPEEALTLFEQAIDLEPHQAEAHLARGEVLESLGRVDEALAAYFRSSELNPSLAMPIVRAAAIQLNRSKPEQALVRLDHALELAPEDGEVRYRRGLALLALNRFSAASADLELAARSTPDRPEVLLAWAKALEADHRPDLARQARDRASKLQPEGAVARDSAPGVRR